MTNIIKTHSCFVPSREQTRAGFLAFALEKNRCSTTIIESAKSLKKRDNKIVVNTTENADIIIYLPFK
jgi:hypothetical protein